VIQSPPRTTTTVGNRRLPGRRFTMNPLSDDEFRLLAFMRGYADACEQRLDPNWLQLMLEFTPDRMRRAARGLVERGLAEFFEWAPSKVDLLFEPEIGQGPFMCDIRLTLHGWNALRRAEV
jgi:hypothetical protein